MLTSSWNAGAAVGQGGSKSVEGNENFEKYKMVTNNASFCTATKLTSKTITEIIESYSEASGRANGCNKYVSSRS